MLLGPGEQSSVAELGSGAGFPRSRLGYGLSSFLTTTHGKLYNLKKPFHIHTTHVSSNN